MSSSISTSYPVVRDLYAASTFYKFVEGVFPRDMNHDKYDKYHKNHHIEICFLLVSVPRIGFNF